MAPSPFGCVVSATFGPRLPLIEIKGPSREAVFERAALFLQRLKRKTRRPVAIAATVETPAPPPSHRVYRDCWTIIVGAGIALSPTAIDPYFPRGLPARSPPSPAAVRG